MTLLVVAVAVYLYASAQWYLFFRHNPSYFNEKEARRARRR